MTRKELNDFIYASQHSTSLRERLKQCKNLEDILELSKSYGFTLTMQDIADDKEAERIENWFQISKISPLRRI